MHKFGARSVCNEDGYYILSWHKLLLFSEIRHTILSKRDKNVVDEIVSDNCFL